MQNILILGSGGREHCFTWKISQSNQVDQLYVAPGNAGTAQIAQNIDLQLSDFEGIASFCIENEVNLVVVGPEAPLVDGIVDFFKGKPQYQHIKLIGPSAEAAQLEGSKAYANAFMSEFGIPTASSINITADNLSDGLSYIENNSGPYVLKADGLAAGKGVLIIESPSEAKMELESMLSGKFGNASKTVVIEEFLDGIEFSVFVLTDGNDYVLLPVAKDYKRIGEGDTGLNTGGMGSISPVSFVDDAMMEKVKTRIVEPTIKGLNSRSLDYKGFIFLGLIKVNNEPYVIEYNCRMGDPETEVVLPRIKSDLVDLLNACANQSLSTQTIEINPNYCTCVMTVSGGYPEAYEKNKLITGFELLNSEAIVFHAGTKIEDGKIVTNGGRVLAFSAFGTDKDDALTKSKSAAQAIQFDKKYFRKDIGFDLE